MNDSPLVVCLNCACVHPSAAEPDSRCPDCQSAFDPEFYEKFRNYAEHVVTFGVIYRQRYEKDLQTYGKLPKRYAIGVSEALVFFALAVLSGTVGGAAYDLVKSVLYRIAEQFEKIAKDRLNSGLVDGDDIAQIRAILNNTEQLESFMKMLRDFEGGMVEVDVSVRQAIEEEIRVHNTTDSVMKSLRPLLDKAGEDLSIADPVELQRILQSGLRASFLVNVPSKPTGEWPSLWEGVPRDPSSNQASN